MFVLTSDYEGMPNSLREAMALGLPVISTNVGGIPYIISNDVDGMLVEPDDVDAMVNSVHKLVDDTPFLNHVTEMSVKKSKSFYSSTVKNEWIKLLYNIKNR